MGSPLSTAWNKKLGYRLHLAARFRRSLCGKVLSPHTVCQPSVARESSPCCQDEAIKTRFAKATPRKTPNKVDLKRFRMPFPDHTSSCSREEKVWARKNISNWDLIGQIMYLIGPCAYMKRLPTYSTPAPRNRPVKAGSQLFIPAGGNKKHGNFCSSCCLIEDGQLKLCD